MSKAKAITNEIIENNYTQIFLFRILIITLFVLFISYIYLIGSITFNVLERKSLEGDIRTLGNNISELEIVYLNNTNEINKNYAISKGFVEARQSIFATRDSERVAIR